MNKPLISIVIAIYNGEKFLEKCINSVIEQDYTNIEIILVNDGSTDKSKSICEKYKKIDKRIVLINQLNKGVCIARNNGIKISNGEYICIIDQDDWIEKNYISYLYNLIKTTNSEISAIPQVILSTSNASMYKEKNQKEKIEVWSGEKAACEMLYANMEIGPWNKMISKKLLNDNKIDFHKELFGGEGYAFSVESFMYAKKVAIGYHGLYHYRIDNYNSEMSKFRIRTAQSSLRAVEIMNNMFKNQNIEVNKALEFAKWNVYNVYIYRMIASDSKKEYIKEYNEWRKILKKDINIMLKAPIDINRKIHTFLIVYMPCTFVLLRKIKNLFKKNLTRDFQKGNERKLKKTK